MPINKCSFEDRTEFFCLLFKLVLVHSGITSLCLGAQTKQPQKLLAATITHNNPTTHISPKSTCLILNVLLQKRERDKKHQKSLSKQSLGRQNSAKGIRTVNMSAGDVTMFKNV